MCRHSSIFKVEDIKRTRRTIRIWMRINKNRCRVMIEKQSKNEKNNKKTDEGKQEQMQSNDRKAKQE